MENTSQPDKEVEKQDENTPPTPESTGPDTAAEEFKGQIKQLQDDLTEAKDKYLRLYAEFDNFRRRTSKERIELIQSANENLISVMIPVLDDFERAEKSFRDLNDKASEGFFLIQNKFRKVLENAGVKPMDTVSGSEFDPDLHDAITQVPAPDKSLVGKIVDVVEKGYTLNEKVIRHAKVVVGN